MCFKTTVENDFLPIFYNKNIKEVLMEQVSEDLYTIAIIVRAGVSEKAGK